MFRTAILMVFFCLKISILFGQSFASVKGRDIIGPDGKMLNLRGVNLGFWLEPEGYPMGISNKYAPREYFDLMAELIGPDDARMFWRKYQDVYITRDDIHYIRELGFNSVRVPFDYRLFVNEYFLGSYQPRGFELLDSAVRWCELEKLWVILDMHCAPGGQSGWNTDGGYTYPWLFEDNGEESRKLTTKIWTEIAGRYAKNPIVLGYDLLGEPIHQYCDTGKFNKRLEPFYKNLVAEIRKVDKNHILILGGAHWDRNFDVFTEPFDPKLVYTTHLYNNTDAFTSFDYFVNFSIKHNVPVWLGEFGEVESSWVEGTRIACEKNHIGWCLWTYKKMDNDHCIVKIDQPANFDLVTNFANGCYKEIIEKVTTRPDYPRTKQALMEYLENCRYKNCKKSGYYSEALNLK